MKKIFFIFLLLHCFKLFSNEKVVIVCWEESLPNSMKVNNKIVGIDIELLEKTLNKLNYKIKYENVPWKRCLEGIKNGSYDATIGAAKNKERESFALFSSGYFATSTVLYTRLENNKKYNIKNPIELLKFNHFSLATVRGYDYGDEVSNLLNNQNFKDHIEETESEEKNFLNLAKGKFDGMFADEISGQFKINQLKLNNEIGPISNKLPSDFAYFIFSRKKYKKEFINEFNIELEKLKKDGEYQKLIKKYLKVN